MIRTPLSRTVHMMLVQSDAGALSQVTCLFDRALSTGSTGASMPWSDRTASASPISSAPMALPWSLMHLPPAPLSSPFRGMGVDPFSRQMRFRSSTATSAAAAGPATGATAAAAGSWTNEKSHAGQVVAPHPGLKKEQTAQEADYVMHHPVYDKEYIETIKPSHKPIETLHHRIGYWTVFAMRSTFDYFTNYGHGKMTEAKWLQRIIFLETVAGVPGMVGGMLRHMRSLRTMERDHGWINTLLEESENERMHLLTFMHMRKPGLMFRGMVLLSQGIFFNLFFITYLMFPKICHSFVGYLEEEAVKTYTHLLEEIDEGKVWKDVPAPEIAINYWKLSPEANMRDLVLAVRADEACHAHVNHTFSDLKANDTNPFIAGKSQLP